MDSRHEGMQVCVEFLWIPLHVISTQYAVACGQFKSNSNSWTKRKPILEVQILLLDWNVSDFSALCHLTETYLLGVAYLMVSSGHNQATESDKNTVSRERQKETVSVSLYDKYKQQLTLK